MKIETTSSVALLGYLGLNLATQASAAGIAVKNPGDVVIGDQITIKWESIGKNKFDIALFEGDYCEGTAVADLCGKSQGCGDSAGDYNVIVPLSVNDGQYSILVSVHDDPSMYGCTGEFLASLNEPEGSKEAYLNVFAPVEDVTAGLEFTALWKYDDGNGVTKSRFTIDLYEADCTGGKLATLCNKPEIGCSDSAGDYPVTIPATIIAGEYSIKIALFGATMPSGCSPAFYVESNAVATVAPTVGNTVASTAEGTPEATATPTNGEDADSPWIGHLETKEPCDSTISFDVRYAESSSRIYFEHSDGERGGCATLSQVLDLRTETNGTIKGPLYPIDPDTNELKTHISEVTGYWLVDANIIVSDGITLQLYGTEIGGDCSELRIKSTDDVFYNLRGHGGSLDMMNTKITSWDTDNNAVHEPSDYSETSDDTKPRSYISCVSERLVSNLECEGRAQNEMGECRMDIVNSEIAYLGYYGSEAYGLTWKVRGYCTDKSNPELFDMVATRGDVRNSNIHHLFYGLYTYGHNGGLWNDNQMHDNEWYGFDPHDDSDYLTIHNNKVWGNGKHGIIASKRCNHVSIQNNVVYDGGEEAAGIFLHRSSDHAIVKGNHIYNMQDAGMATLESFNINFQNNLVQNCKYGIRLSLGAAGNTVQDNTFEDLSSYAMYTYAGSNEPDVEGGAYRPYNNYFLNNALDTPVVCKIKEADGIVMTGNIFNNAELVTFDDSAENDYRDNTIDDDVLQEVKNGACFTAESDLSPTC